MDSEDKDSDEEELEALRLAALATLKSSRTVKLKSESSETSTTSTASPIIPSTFPPAPYIRKEPVHQPPNQYSWRNSALQSRRGRGRGGFPPRGGFLNINQRSNLIVITPVSTDDKDSTEKAPVPQLSLPQHKWCQAANENSSSPKTYSRRGPTRFNRHESGSESDSDYDDPSDQDSYSNETILQDENSVNFAQLTPEESIESESPLTTQRNSDHRLSFQHANLDSIQPAEDVQSSKSTYPIGLIADTTVSSSTLNDSINRDSTNYSSYQEYNPTPSTSYQSQIVSAIPVNGGLRIDQDYDGNCRRISDATPDSFSGSGTKSTSVDPNLSQDDLRQELKKRMLKLRSEAAELAKSETQSLDKHVRDERRTGDDFRSGFSRDHSSIHNRSRSDITFNTRVRNRSRSLTRDHNRLRSPSPRNPDRERSHSHERDRKRAERNSKRDCSRSPELLPGRRHNRGSTRSPNRNGKRSWSRSPVKMHRRTSVSPIRNNKRNYSRSPERSKKRNYSRSSERSNKHNYSRSPERSNNRNYSRSPERSNKRNYSHSPERSNNRKYSRSPERSKKRNYSHSPEQSKKHDKSRSPLRSNKHDKSRSPLRRNKHDKSRSPERSNKYNYNRSPEQNEKCNYSPDKSKKQDHGYSPSKSTKRISSPSPVKDKSSHSPYKCQKRSSTRSPDRTSKHDSVPRKSHKHSGTQSPIRNRKRNSSRSPDKSHRKLLPKSPERKHKHNINKSPLQSQKRDSSRSPKKKSSRLRRDRSRSPVQSHRHDSSESPERKPGRNRNKKSRHRWSRSSSGLSSSSGSASSSSGYAPCARSISSVIKPVQSSAPAVKLGFGSKDKRSLSPDSDFSSDLKKRKDLDEKPKALLSLVKSSIVVGENRNNAPDSGKRLPVHMRLGTLPRNKLIQMTKDVEAAFVNTSSDEEANTDGKKQNYRVVAEMNANKGDILKRHVKKSPSKNSSVMDSKSQRKKTYR